MTLISASVSIEKRRPLDRSEMVKRRQFEGPCAIVTITGWPWSFPMKWDRTRWDGHRRRAVGCLVTEMLVIEEESACAFGGVRATGM